MSRKSKNKGGDPKIAVGKVLPLLDMLKICKEQGLRLWVQTSCPPAHLPVDMAFMQQREAEMYKTRKYHAIWLEITTNHSINNGIIHCRYVDYKHAEKAPYAQGHALEEKERLKAKDIIKLLKTIKTNNHAENQNLHSESIRKIRRKRTIR